MQATCDRVQIIRAGKLIYNAPIGALRQDRDSSSACIALRQAVKPDEITAIAGIEQVEALPNGRYRVHFAADADADALLSTAVAQHWGLYELVPEQQSLEDLFIELTQDELGDEVAETDEDQG